MRLAAAFLVLLVLVALPAPAAGAQPCWKAVLRDWYGDGVISASYPRECLIRAKAALPQDEPPPSSLVRQLDAQIAEQPLLKAAPAERTARRLPFEVWLVPLALVLLLGVAGVGRVRRHL